MFPRSDPPSPLSPWGWSPLVRFGLTALALAAGLSLAMLADRTRAAKPFTPDLAVDPNTAPLSLLLALPQVGPSRASAIIEARSRTTFHSLRDFERDVPGIGPSTAAMLAPYLRFPTDIADARAGP